VGRGASRALARVAAVGAWRACRRVLFGTQTSTVWRRPWRRSNASVSIRRNCARWPFLRREEFDRNSTPHSTARTRLEGVTRLDER